MARSKRRIYGHIKCTDCGALTDINRQEDDKHSHGRFYWNCKNNRVCLAHHRFSPNIGEASEVPGYIPLPDAAPIRNVAEPEKPATVSQPKQEEQEAENGWFGF